jgi:hypothetical protein
MEPQTSCPRPARPEQAEAVILSMLLNPDGGCIWSVEELVRELSSSRLQVEDGLAGLQGAGLVHRVDEFVFATRAAWRFDGLDM